MAREKKKKPPTSDPKKVEFISLARKRHSRGISAEEHNREDSLTDLRFINGDHWDIHIRNDRNNDGRPCLTYNDLPTYIAQVVGDQRQNRPSGKVHPVDSGADPKTALTIEGLVRQIESNSRADLAYDWAFQQAVEAGVPGHIRILTAYTEDDSFEQEIKIKRVKNRFAVIWDPASQEPDKSDAMWVFLDSSVSRDVFEEKWPDKTPTDWEMQNSEVAEWYQEDMVRITEYFVKEPVVKTICLLEDGRVLEKESLEEYDIIAKERKVKSHKIYRYLLCGHDILEDKQEWPSKFWPLIPVEGPEMDIDGKSYKRGLIHFSLDACRAYNYSRSTDIETFALAPKAPWLATARQVEGFENLWQVVHKKSLPYLPYNPDPLAPGPPSRTPPINANTAITQSTLLAQSEKQATIGIFNASIGQRSNEVSGTAIGRRQKEADVGTFVYQDNLGRAIKQVWAVCLDLIPTIYDTERIVRIMGEDGSVESVTINQATTVSPQGEIGKRLNDLTVGKYDVTITIGPSYTTQRVEAAESMMAFVQAAPMLAPAIADMIARNQDWPGAQEISKRLKAWMVQQGMATLLTEKEMEELPQGPPQPPQPPPPDPVMEMKMIQEQLKTQQQEAKLDQALLGIEKLKLELGQTMSQFEMNLMTKLEEHIGKMIQGQGQGMQGQGQMQPQMTPPGQMVG